VVLRECPLKGFMASSLQSTIRFIQDDFNSPNNALKEPLCGRKVVVVNEVGDNRLERSDTGSDLINRSKAYTV
jgi:hypothetical protein